MGSWSGNQEITRALSMTVLNTSPWVIVGLSRGNRRKRAPHVHGRLDLECAREFVNLPAWKQWTSVELQSATFLLPRTVMIRLWGIQTGFRTWSRSLYIWYRFLLVLSPFLSILSCASCGAARCSDSPKGHELSRATLSLQTVAQCGDGLRPWYCRP